MNVKKSLENRIRGWLPKEPTLPQRYTGDTSEKPRRQPPKNNGSRLAAMIVFAVLGVFFGVTNLFTRQYTMSLIYFASSTALIVFAYFFYKYNFVVRPRLVFGVLFVALGVLFVFLNGVGDSIFSFPALFTVTLFSVQGILPLAIVLLIVLAVFGLVLRRQREISDTSPWMGQFLPYCVSAVIIFLSYLIVLSGIVFEYSIAAAFLVMGVLVLKGLRRFAVTSVALAALLISILVFGSALAGSYTTSYVATENNYINSAQVPNNISTLNLAVGSVDGDINIYFASNNSQVSHTVFLQQYGPVARNGGVEYYSRYGGDEGEPKEPNSTYSYSVQNGTVGISAWTFTNNIDITLNQNFKVNLTCSATFGNIVVHVPSGVNPVQHSNLHSRYGNTQTVNG